MAGFFSWTVNLLATTVPYGHGYLVLQRIRISYVIDLGSFALATHLSFETAQRTNQ